MIQYFTKTTPYKHLITGQQNENQKTINKRVISIVNNLSSR